MKRSFDLKYISNRVILLGGVTAAVLLVFCAVQAVLVFQGDAPAWSVIVSVLFTAAYLAVGRHWIVMPYVRLERRIRRFLDGHMLTKSEEFDLAALTPSMRAQMELIEKIVRSPQTMDLNVRQAQYLALQNQINPHFLYNTLESIRGEALIAGVDGVADMTEALAKFFRYTITKVENLVSVEEELDNCETYFWIQKYRFGERLKLHIECDPEEWEQVMSCRIPKLTLQPILENSIIHGTELKMGTGNLYIRFSSTQERLIIRISDDGVGMDEETLAKLNRKLGKNTEPLYAKEEQKGGIALANVNNRIHLIFGDEYGLHVYSMPQQGTDVEISIPMHFDDKAVKNRGVLL